MTELKLIAVGACAEQPIDLEVVFFHGLGGDAQESWGGPEESGFWPGWLLKDLKGVAVFSLGYVAPKFHTDGTNANMPLYDKAGELCDYLLSSGLGKKPLLIVCHSLGGLLVKQIMRACEGSTEKKRKKLIENIRGIVFLATPHDGSIGADIVKCFPIFNNSKIVQAMQSDADGLRELKEWFSGNVANRNIPVKAYCETKPTFGSTLLVNKNSANPDVHGCVLVPADDDHVSIAKPANQNAAVYKGVKQFIEECQKDSILPVAINPEVSRLDDEINKYKEQLDRLDLEEKLSLGGRDFEIPTARRKREAFDRKFKKHAAQKSSQDFFTKILGQVETRFHLHVYPKIVEGTELTAVNTLLQDQVVDPILQAHGHEEGVNAALIRSVGRISGCCRITDGWIERRLPVAARAASTSLVV